MFTQAARSKLRPVAHGTAALAADTCTISYRGRGGSFGIKVGDTWATIATNAQTFLATIPDFPATVTISTDTLTLTARHKGAFDDGAVQVDFANAAGSGCAASPGTYLFTGTAGVGGTATLTLGVGAPSFTVTASDTAIVSVGHRSTLAAFHARHLRLDGRGGWQVADALA